MSFPQNPIPSSGSAFATTKTMDAGLRAHMIRVFNTVAAGLAITALSSLAVFMIEPLRVIFMNPLVSTGIGIGLLVFLWFGMNPNKMMQQSLGTVRMKYIIFTALLGTTMAYIYVAYNVEALTRVFFITSAMFAGTSLYGYTTKRDMSSMGTFLMMGLIGLILAIVVNIFLQSSMMGFVISCVGVLLFTGLIAVQTQNAHRMYNAANPDDLNQKLAIYSAFGLYISFINLFQFLLSLLGGRQ